MDTSTTIPARAAQAASEAKNAQITTLEVESSALDAQTADGARPSAHSRIRVPGNCKGIGTMAKNVLEEITMYSYPMSNWRVDILNSVFEGGGSAWEFSIWTVTDPTHNLYRETHHSTNEYGTPEGAAAAGFTWIVEQGHKRY
jgi:hypothetical protein